MLKIHTNWKLILVSVSGVGTLAATETANVACQRKHVDKNCWLTDHQICFIFNIFYGVLNLKLLDYCDMWCGLFDRSLKSESQSYDDVIQ